MLRLYNLLIFITQNQVLGTRIVMKLKTLIEQYKGNLSELNKKGLNDVEVPERVVQFIAALANKTLLSQEEFIVFGHYCMSEKAVSDFLIDIVYSIFQQIYKRDYKTEIKTTIATIESSLKASKPIPVQAATNNDRYHALINNYLFFIFVAPHSDVDFQNTVIFGLNALRLTGCLAREGVLAGLDLSQPFYPLKLNSMMQHPVALSPGFKDAAVYFPFKYTSKIAQGDTGDNTFLATNGEKLLFVRGVPKYTPAGVFASKIAKLISAKHFSSERVLTSSVVAARGLPGYAFSVVDSALRMKRKEQIEKKKRVFPGSGIIDEVCNFVQESDFNAENFGFSTAEVEDEACYLSKIDFDRCSFLDRACKISYDYDILTRPQIGIYHGADHIQNDAVYIYEKLYTRMKLCLIPDDLLAQLADRSYLPKDAKQKEKDLQEACNRKKIALELFFEHPKVRSFLEENPNILHQCFQEIADYINKHYPGEEQNSRLQSALKESLAEMQQAVWEQVQIRLAVEPTQEKKVESVEAVSDSELEPHSTQKLDSTGDLLSQLKPEVVYQPKPITAKAQSAPKKIILPKAEKEGFFSRHGGKILTLVLFALIGIGVGAALTATGVLAPFGAGVLGYTFGCLSGFASGLFLGGLTLSAEAVFGCCTPSVEEDFFEMLSPTNIKQSSFTKVPQAYVPNEEQEQGNNHDFIAKYSLY